MPHHHHRRGGGRRYGGPAYYGGTDVIFDTPDQLDVLVVPEEDVLRLRRLRSQVGDLNEVPPDDVYVPKGSQAGDILPTFVTPADAAAYLGQVDTGYTQLNAAVLASTVVDSFKIGWALQIAGWKAFYTGALPSIGWLNTKAVMDQADRYQKELIEWRRSFAASGGNPPGPDPLPPGQGTGSGAPSASDLTKLVLAVSAVAALVILGPALARHF